MTSEAGRNNNRSALWESLHRGTKRFPGADADRTDIRYALLKDLTEKPESEELFSGNEKAGIWTHATADAGPRGCGKRGYGDAQKDG